MRTQVHSRPASPQPETVATVSSHISNHPRPEQGQTHLSTLTNAGVRSAFLSERTASDFMSCYGGNTKLINRVYKMGLGIDELTAARAHFLARAREIKAHLGELSHHFPAGPHLDDIIRKVQTINPLCRPKD